MVLQICCDLNRFALPLDESGKPKRSGFAKKAVAGHRHAADDAEPGREKFFAEGKMRVAPRLHEAPANWMLAVDHLDHLSKTLLAASVHGHARRVAVAGHPISSNRPARSPMRQARIDMRVMLPGCLWHLLVRLRNVTWERWLGLRRIRPSLATTNRRNRLEITNGRIRDMRSERAKAVTAAARAADHPEDMATGKARGSATSSTAAAPASSTLNGTPEDVEFYLAVDVHYHRARQAWLETAHRWMMFLAIMFGSAAAADWLPAAVCGLLAALAAGADLAFDFTGRAAQHGELARKYLGIARQLSARPNDAVALAAVQDAMLEASGDEPPVYHAVRDLSHNLAVTSLGRDQASKVEITRWQLWFAHCWRFEDRG